MKNTVMIPVKDIQIGDKIARAHGVLHKPHIVRTVDSADGSCKGIHINDTMCYHRAIGRVEIVVDGSMAL